jgi:hypothetical protein
MRHFPTQRLVPSWAVARACGLLLCLALVPTMALAQGQIGRNDNCRQLKANLSGVAGADIVVDVTAVTVIAANQSLCGATITNLSNTNPVRCRAIPEGQPTATVGVYLGPGGTLGLSLEAQRGINCIRDTSATGSAALNTMELTP